MNIIINETGEQVTLKVLDSRGIDYFADLAAGDQQIVFDRDAEAYRADQATVDWWRERIQDIYDVEVRADEVAYDTGRSVETVMAELPELGDDLEHYKENAIALLDEIEAEWEDEDDD